MGKRQIIVASMVHVFSFSSFAASQVFLTFGVFEEVVHDAEEG